LRRWVGAETIADIINPYRASFTPELADPTTGDEAAASMNLPPVPTLYLHGSRDGAIGAELLTNPAEFLPAPGSAFELLDGVGHFLHLEKPDEVWLRISSWLAA
jgi:pimeloyl-ACP methyl ester carboxylesterase